MNVALSAGRKDTGTLREQTKYSTTDDYAKFIGIVTHGPMDILWEAYRGTSDPKPTKNCIHKVRY